MALSYNLPNCLVSSSSNGCRGLHSHVYLSEKDRPCQSASGTSRNTKTPSSQRRTACDRAGDDQVLFTSRMSWGSALRGCDHAVRPPGRQGPSDPERGDPARPALVLHPDHQLSVGASDPAGSPARIALRRAMSQHGRERRLAERRGDLGVHVRILQTNEDIAEHRAIPKTKRLEPIARA